MSRAPATWHEKYLIICSGTHGNKGYLRLRLPDRRDRLRHRRKLAALHCGGPGARRESMAFPMSRATKGQCRSQPQLFRFLKPPPESPRVAKLRFVRSVQLGRPPPRQGDAALAASHETEAAWDDQSVVESGKIAFPEACFGRAARDLVEQELRRHAREAGAWQAVGAIDPRGGLGPRARRPILILGARRARLRARAAWWRDVTSLSPAPRRRLASPVPLIGSIEESLPAPRRPRWLDRYREFPECWTRFAATTGFTLRPAVGLGGTGACRAIRRNMSRCALRRYLVEGKVMRERRTLR